MIAQLDQISTILLDRFQQAFPLVPEPFELVGGSAGTNGAGAIKRYRQLVKDGFVSRIGAVVTPNVFTTSTLAAMSVPENDLERVAQLVSEQPGVNHNYEREGRVNLWFVVSAADEDGLMGALARIETETGLHVLDLRLEEPFHLDLGFPLDLKTEKRSRLVRPDMSAIRASDGALLAQIEDGIPLVSRPYLEAGKAIGLSEADVLDRLEALKNARIIRRFGVVVNHRTLGMRANAMAVWDIADVDVTALGKRFAREAGVTLCYRRRRARCWPYNLYCMVHGTERTATLRVVNRLNELAAGRARAHTVLFSERCFKQTGARFGSKRQAA